MIEIEKIDKISELNVLLSSVESIIVEEQRFIGDHFPFSYVPYSDNIVLDNHSDELMYYGNMKTQIVDRIKYLLKNGENKKNI